MRKATKLGLVALTVGLAIAILPMCGAKSARMGFSHPRMDNLMMGVGENIVFQVAVHNEGDNFLDIWMTTDNSNTAENGWENLDSVVKFDPETATLKPREIMKITVTFNPPHSGIYEGDILAIPLEDREGSVPIGSAMGCRVHITATENIENQDNEQEPSQESGEDPLKIPFIVLGFSIGILASIVVGLKGHKLKQFLKKIFRISLIALLLLGAMAPIALAESDSMDGDVNVVPPPNPPGAPTLYLPSNGANVDDNTPYFEWTEGSDATSHRLRVDNDSNFSSPEIDNSGLTENNFTAPELSEDLYYWKVTAHNNDGDADSSTWTFRVDITPPDAPALVSPDNDDNITDKTPTLDWNSVSDNSTPVLYYLAMSDNSDFPYENNNSGWISQTQYTTPELAQDIWWYWRVGANDNAGNVGENSVSWQFMVSIPAYAVDIQISPNSRTGMENDNVTFTVTVTNIGDNYDNYTLTVGQTLVWGISLDDNLFENVAPEENRTTTLRVTLGSPTTNTITVTATSQGDNTVSDNASCTATSTAPEAEEELEDWMKIMLFLLPFIFIGLAMIPSSGATVFGFLGGTVAIMDAFIFTSPTWLMWIFLGLGVFLVLTATYVEYKKGRGK